jgi:hypothetical protein
MDVGDDTPFQPNHRYAVQVYADKNPARKGEESENLNLEGGKSEYKLTVFLTTSSGLKVNGPETRQLTINPAKTRADCELFEVEVIRAEPLHQATITATFFYEGRSCGGVTQFSARRGR